MTYIDNIRKVTGIESTATISASARDRQRWRNMTGQACIMQGTQASKLLSSAHSRTVHSSCFAFQILDIFRYFRY